MAVEEASINETGVASVLRVWYFDAAGLVGNNTTGLYETWTDAHYADYQVSGATEDGTSGRYRLTRPSWVVTPGSLEWHKIAGGTPSTDPQVGTASLEGESFTAQPGTTPPATRRLYFRLKQFGVFTDPTGSVVYLRDPTQTFGVRRQDTGAVIVGVSPLQQYTRESVGSYYFEIAETGLALEYGAEYTDPITGALTRSKLDSTYAQANGEYSTDADVDGVLAGTTNANLWHDGENKGDGVHIAAMRKDKRRRATARLHVRVKAALKKVGKTVVTPFVPTDSDTAASLTQVHALYVAGYAVWAKEGQGTRDRPNKGDNFIALGDELLDSLVAADLPGIELIDLPDETKQAGSFESVPIIFEPEVVVDEFSWVE